MPPAPRQADKSSPAADLKWPTIAWPTALTWSSYSSAASSGSSATRVISITGALCPCAAAQGLRAQALGMMMKQGQPGLLLVGLLPVPEPVRRPWRPPV
jgi:hypothetical protein